MRKNWRDEFKNVAKGDDGIPLEGWMAISYLEKEIEEVKLRYSKTDIPEEQLAYLNYIKTMYQGIKDIMDCCLD